MYLKDLGRENKYYVIQFSHIAHPAAMFHEGAQTHLNTKVSSSQSLHSDFEGAYSNDLALQILISTRKKDSF
ncbi:hypothetical protein NBRC116583_20770 [Arenicella sp. 4NH20-0111]